MLLYGDNRQIAYENQRGQRSIEVKSRTKSAWLAQVMGATIADKMAKAARNRGNVSEIRRLLHPLLCVAALIAGFRLTREFVFLITSISATEGSIFISSSNKPEGRTFPEDSDIALRYPYIKKGVDSSWQPHAFNAMKSSRVNVGRHDILIRQFPHPDPVETFHALQLIELVQEEQRRLHGAHDFHRQLLVITPTYVRTFQALLLSSLIHTLRIVPGPLIWIVIEAGGVTNETESLLSTSKINYHHLGIKEPMPADQMGSQLMEARLRTMGLSFIKKHRLDGVVVFADDSNTYTLDFFAEALRVKWVGAFSVGILSSSELKGSALLPVKGPACNSTDHLVGWYGLNQNTMGNDNEEVYRVVEWAGFALNARLLWDHVDSGKSWSKLFDASGSSLKTALLGGTKLIEPLGQCGRKVLLWWLRVEARFDSKFPSRWLINSPLEITVPSKVTPWRRNLNRSPPVEPKLPSKHKKQRTENNSLEQRDQQRPRHGSSNRTRKAHTRADNASSRGT